MEEKMDINKLKLNNLKPDEVRLEMCEDAVIVFSTKHKNFIARYVMSGPEHTATDISRLRRLIKENSAKRHMGHRVKGAKVAFESYRIRDDGSLDFNSALRWHFATVVARVERKPRQSWYGPQYNLIVAVGRHRLTIAEEKTLWLGLVEPARQFKRLKAAEKARASAEGSYNKLRRSFIPMKFVEVNEKGKLTSPRHAPRAANSVTEA